MPTLLEMLARRPTIAVMEQEHGKDGVTLTAKPARELVMFPACRGGPPPPFHTALEAHWSQTRKSAELVVCAF